MTPDSAAVRATKGRPMKPWIEITHYAGFDWARDHHDVVIVDRQGQIVADFRIEHSLAGSTHKIHPVRELLSARGVGLRYLPPYSPDLNPIELAFAKLKAHLRQAAARTLDDLHSSLAMALDSFSAQHCRGFFRHAQYASI
jgi:hypothetical protein